MYKLFGVLIVLISLLIPVEVFAVGSGNASLSLSPSSNTYNIGCSFTLDVNLDTDGANTDGTDVILRYDPSILTATSIDPGSTYSDYPNKSIDSSGGVISISGLASVNQPFNGSGKFATIHFNVNSSANASSAQVKFDFDAANPKNTKDSNVVKSVDVVDILRSVTNGTYAIGSGVCTNGSGSGSVNTPGVSGGGTITPGGATGTSFDSGGTSKGGLASGSATLPQAGISGPTLILATLGSIFVLAGILGLALL